MHCCLLCCVFCFAKSMLRPCIATGKIDLWSVLAKLQAVHTPVPQRLYNLVMHLSSVNISSILIYIRHFGLNRFNIVLLHNI